MKSYSQTLLPFHVSNLQQSESFKESRAHTRMCLHMTRRRDSICAYQSRVHTRMCTYTHVHIHTCAHTRMCLHITRCRGSMCVNQGMRDQQTLRPLNAPPSKDSETPDELAYRRDLQLPCLLNIAMCRCAHAFLQTHIHKHLCLIHIHACIRMLKDVMRPMVACVIEVEPPSTEI